jgi:hypothetical protein
MCVCVCVCVCVCLCVCVCVCVEAPEGHLYVPAKKADPLQAKTLKSPLDSEVLGFSLGLVLLQASMLKSQ